MVKLIATWEFGWLPSTVEAMMWRQLVGAYNCGRYCLVSNREDPDGMVRYTNIKTALDEFGGTPVFLIPNTGRELPHYTHPADATYIFGNALQSNLELALSTPSAQIVQIPTPRSTDMFAINAASIVLHDRNQKQ
jgi:hypothetical protein